MSKFWSNDAYLWVQLMYRTRLSSMSTGFTASEPVSRQSCKNTHVSLSMKPNVVVLTIDRSNKSHFRALLKTSLNDGAALITDSVPSQNTWDVHSFVSCFTISCQTGWYVKLVGLVLVALWILLSNDFSSRSIIDSQSMPMTNLNLIDAAVYQGLRSFSAAPTCELKTCQVIGRLDGRARPSNRLFADRELARWLQVLPEKRPRLSNRSDLECTPWGSQRRTQLYVIEYLDCFGRLVCSGTVFASWQLSVNSSVN